MEFTIIDALVTSVIGAGVVMSILALIAVLIILASKAIRAIEAKAVKKADAPVAAPVAEASPSVVAVDREVELIGTDEKTAAVIMAIVSKESGIPVERLSFKSIKLLDSEKKGDEAK